MKRSGMLSATYTSLSTVTKRCLKTKATNLHRTPPLHKHFVMHMCRSQPSPGSTDTKALDVG